MSLTSIVRTAALGGIVGISLLASAAPATQAKDTELRYKMFLPMTAADSSAPAPAKFDPESFIPKSANALKNSSFDEGLAYWDRHLPAHKDSIYAQGGSAYLTSKQGSIEPATHIWQDVHDPLINPGDTIRMYAIVTPGSQRQIMTHNGCGIGVDFRLPLSADTIEPKYQIIKTVNGPASLEKGRKVIVTMQYQMPTQFEGDPGGRSRGSWHVYDASTFEELQSGTQGGMNVDLWDNQTAQRFLGKSMPQVRATPWLHQWLQSMDSCQFDEVRFSVTK